MYKYIVFSPKPEYYRELKEIILPLCRTLTKSHHVLLVEEHGKNNDHPHLNLVYDKYYTDIREYKKFWNRQLGSTIVKNNPFLYGNPKSKKHIQNVVSPQRLIEGYLKKESNAKILVNNTNMHDMQQQAQIQSEIKKIQNITKLLADDIQTIRRHNNWSPELSQKVQQKQRWNSFIKNTKLPENNIFRTNIQNLNTHATQKNI